MGKWGLKKWKYQNIAMERISLFKKMEIVSGRVAIYIEWISSKKLKESERIWGFN